MGLYPQNGGGGRASRRLRFEGRWASQTHGAMERGVRFMSGGKGERTEDSILRAADGNDRLDRDAFARLDKAPREQAPLREVID